MVYYMKKKRLYNALHLLKLQRAHLTGEFVIVVAIRCFVWVLGLQQWSGSDQEISEVRKQSDLKKKSVAIWPLRCL